MPEMTREQAEQRAAELNREHPDRARYRWLAHEDEGGWQVTRVAMPAGLRIDPTKATVESKPRPPQQDDPRPAFWRDVGGPWAGGG